MTIDWEELEREFHRALGDLPGARLDRDRIERMLAGIASGSVGIRQNRITGRVEPARSRDLDSLELFSESETMSYAELGSRALQAGEVAAAVLNGGMATRFGGTVKGIVRALGARTFLELKLAQARRLSPAPFVIMNSFATSAATDGFLVEKNLWGDTQAFLQGVSLRLTPAGGIFRNRAGAISPYAPGHGDFPDFIRESGTLALLRERGVRLLVLSNIDNLGAVLDPAIVGYHVAHESPLTVEVSESVPGDAGGAPAFVDGTLQVVEGFRWPEGFDIESLEIIATNTFVISVELLAETHPMTWFYVEKDVEGRTAVQMERLINELSAHVPTNYLVTPRTGPHGRFFPTKTKADLDRIQKDPDLATRLLADPGERGTPGT